VRPLKTSIPLGIPPYNFVVYKGSKNVILNRTFSHFLLEHPVAQKFKEWSTYMPIPDESFYATLFR
jgi:seryl-tRNA synthetase